MNRRDFFQIASGSVALVAFQDGAIEKARAAGESVTGHQPEDVARNEDYWAEIRNAFTVDRNVINLNNGHVSPAPRPVQDALR
ncbi:MAG: aminotransferase class V-fold PLP-dependent enzyme, partial [Bryobacteraceae bacterium]